MSSRLHASDGQASLEWLALIALVAALLGFGAALAQAGYVGRHVTREMARALCLVGHGDCRRDQEPCVLRAEEGRSARRIDLLIVRLGADAIARIEQLSDGTVEVTKITGGSLGLGAGLEAGARVKVKGIDLSVGIGLTATGDGRTALGQTWIVGTWAQAQALLRRLRSGRAPPPDLESGERDLAATVEASAHAVVRLDAAKGDLSFDGRSRVVVDHRTGHRTVLVAGRAAADGSLAGGVLGLSGATSTGGERYAVEFDAAGRPVDLQVLASGAFDGSRDLPGVVQPVVGLLERGVAQGRTYEVTAHLDLTDPVNLAAARALLAALARGGWPASMPATTQALRRRLDEAGTVEARVLRTRTGGDGFEVSGSLGVKVGAAIQTERVASQLVAAASRGLDGQWVVRDDCPGAGRDDRPEKSA